MHTLSFAVLDDQEFVADEPTIHLTLKKITAKKISKAVMEIADPYLKWIDRTKDLPDLDKDYYPKEGEKCGFGDEYFSKYFDLEEVTKEILRNKYYRCYFDKYYVVIFALDRKIVEITDRDGNKKDVTWKI